jgi:fatty-acyl-CoA synthase
MQNMARDGKASGEIVVRTSWFTQGYPKNPEASGDLSQSGYPHSTDIASIDADGYLRITDRIKDLIKSGGECVSSLETDSLILKQRPSPRSR